MVLIMEVRRSHCALCRKTRLDSQDSVAGGNQVVRTPNLQGASSDVSGPYTGPFLCEQELVVVNSHGVPASCSEVSQQPATPATTATYVTRSAERCT